MGSRLHFQDSVRYAGSRRRSVTKVLFAGRCQVTSAHRTADSERAYIATKSSFDQSDAKAAEALRCVSDAVAPQEQPSTSGRGKLVGSSVTAAGIVLVIAGGAIFKDQIAQFIQYFTSIVDDMGPLGYGLYAVVYGALEVLAVPAIPLTMTAGAIFGIVPGSIVVSLSGAGAATISFLIARYVARDKFLLWAEKNKQFRAINQVVKNDGFKVVTLLRLSPLLPLAASNYLYGLTSVSLKDYFFGSWLGMLPGTVAYVSAGHVSKVAVTAGEELPLDWWQAALAVGISIAVIGYIGSEAKKVLKNMDAEDAK